MLCECRDAHLVYSLQIVWTFTTKTLRKTFYVDRKTDFERNPHGYLPI